MNVFEVTRGDSPIVLGQPHGGTFVPERVFARLNANGRVLADTDWHISKLYEGLLGGATVVRSNIHRYVIDANRDPEGVSLYPGQNTTTLVPLTDFDGQEIWAEGQHPSEDEIEDRRQAYHAPYHAALQAELDRVRDRHGVAILFDCHSIRSQIPFLFDGGLPDFNIGTNLGATCAPKIEAATLSVCADADGYSSVTNGRFKGGWTTRHYGRPETGIHAIQMELAQRAYMDEAAPWTYRNDRADRLRPHLKTILHNLHILALSGALTR
ncbi:N-formylglutamate deformylase [Aliiroseovarius crassostreae]|uniref:N-formylglutamate deformylase n=1 Tax=Aliiroseovarius crassostreae TaxID=154981 RepID=A0A9Q9LUZ1_9RHOB|nr:N-formylglutamate deformylase [Aliiroseovarius crassostreae]UWP95356.1 N-formylglutamate deformylase [Aliiroseovarius crassostreae]UWP98516.1 N-formylglutamate deformylase [Aliiroseovarius crassostreae]